MGLDFNRLDCESGSYLLVEEMKSKRKYSKRKVILGEEQVLKKNNW